MHQGSQVGFWFFEKKEELFFFEKKNQKTLIH